MAKSSDPLQFYAKDRTAWRAWLQQHGGEQSSVWLVYDKGTGRQLSYDDIVEEALCFGWIDSKSGKVSDTQSKIYMSQRKPKSAWSKSNKERILRLRKQGLMTSAGEAAIAIGKANGMWNQLNKSDRFELPRELKQLLADNPKALAFYNQMPPSSHRIILEWIYAAKTDETRLKRIHETVESAAVGIKAHHYRQ